VLNKRDLLDPAEYETRRSEILRRLAWVGPAYGISALTGEGTAELTEDLMRRLEESRQAEGEPVAEAATGDWNPLGRGPKEPLPSP